MHCITCEVILCQVLKANNVELFYSKARSRNNGSNNYSKITFLYNQTLDDGAAQRITVGCIKKGGGVFAGLSSRTCLQDEGVCGACCR